jgi:hypothetical protein
MSAPDLISIRTDLEAWVSMGDKASGGPGDTDSGAWMESRLGLFGYRTRRQAFEAPTCSLTAVRLTVGDVALEGWPQAPVRVTGPVGVHAPLALAGEDAPRGALLVANLPARRWSSVRQAEIAALAETTGTNSAQLVICPRIFASHVSPPTNSF